MLSRVGVETGLSRVNLRTAKLRLCQTLVVLRIIFPAWRRVLHYLWRGAARRHWQPHSGLRHLALCQGRHGRPHPIRHDLDHPPDHRALRPAGSARIVARDTALRANGQRPMGNLIAALDLTPRPIARGPDFDRAACRLQAVLHRRSNGRKAACVSFSSGRYCAFISAAGTRAAGAPILIAATVSPRSFSIGTAIEQRPISSS